MVILTEPVCSKCGKPIEKIDEEFCDDCNRKKHSFDRGYSLFAYSGNVKESLYKLKYSNRREYGVEYGRLLAKRYGDVLSRWNVDAIIPVPLHKKRLYKRGYNQAELISNGIGEITGIPIMKNFVIREKNTKALKTMNPGQRAANIKNAFKITENKVKLNAIVLVDDIYTTGSTIDELSTVIKQYGVKRVYFLTVATGSI